MLKNLIFSYKRWEELFYMTFMLLDLEEKLASDAKQLRPAGEGESSLVSFSLHDCCLTRHVIPPTQTLAPSNAGVPAHRQKPEKPNLQIGRRLTSSCCRSKGCHPLPFIETETTIVYIWVMRIFACTSWCRDGRGWSSLLWKLQALTKSLI